LIVIAPAPVFGFPPMEWIQGQVGKVSPSTADLESWSANPRNIQDAFDLLSRSAPEPLVILSGDVHYGFEVVGRLMSTTVSVPFLQFCSSALKNKTIGGKKLFFDFLSSAGDVRQSFVYWDRSVSGRSDGALYFAEADSYSARVFFDQYGSPSAFIDSFFVQRPDRSGGKQRIEDKNNLGELVVSSATVSHRHWFFEILPQPESMEAPRSRGRFAPRALLSWDPGDWPVKSVLDRLLEALRL
jgi:hypothetical protein